MRFKTVVCLLLFIITIFSVSKNADAVYDPLSVANNKFGIHILFPSELEKAKELVNSNGGMWGYVTIPIQSGDKDLKKWQEFMDDAHDLQLIPILRIATEIDFYDDSVWKKPKEEDILDFANFLNSLHWHTKNRYIIVFNEVNRADEWEGQANPEEYAQILDYAISVFKKSNDDFFIISSGMDNAAETDGKNFNQFDFFQQMNLAVPGIFSRLDGISSHSYPNPGFSEPPDKIHEKSIGSFIFESRLIESLTQKSLPIFITETNWDQGVYTNSEIGEFFKYAFENVWNDKRIIAITPFLLLSNGDQFKNFSLIKDGQKNDIYLSIQNLSKIKGEPTLSNEKTVLSDTTPPNLPVKNFANSRKKNNEKALKSFIKLIILGD